MNLVILILAAIVAVSVFVVFYFLIPLPVISYKQGDASMSIESGIVKNVKKFRCGIWKVKIIKIITQTFKGGQNVSSEGVYSFYFRSWQSMPQTGDEIIVTYKNRGYIFAKKSFNWVVRWYSPNQKNAEEPSRAA